MIDFIPINLMEKRVENAKEDSDTSLFIHLMYSAEQLTKLVTLGLLSCVEEDNNRHRYSLEYKLVRADGVGEWSATIDELLIGPTSHFLCPEIRNFQIEMGSNVKEGAWQYESVRLIHNCLQIVDKNIDGLPIKSTNRNWFSLFSRLRNKTRGHGAIGSDKFSQLCPVLIESLQIQFNNLSILKLPWVYVKRNLNGKYKISSISSSTQPFDYLKSDSKPNLADGIYLHAGSHKFVKLLYSSSELADFYFPNGAFGNHTFECISYLTDDKIYQDVSNFMTPTGSLPESHTEGLGTLEIEGNCFTNVPKNRISYIKRIDLEAELSDKLLDDRHPVITLVGRGGIGKTSLALTVLKDVCQKTKFSLIIWLSARDIDLLVEGPKPVKPNVLTILDIAKEFAKLMDFKVVKNGLSEREFMETELKESKNGPILFVLDNFETVVNPKEVYTWLNTFIRLPNKVLITSRFRDFKGDYPIEVHGMNQDEFRELYNNVANEIGIPELISDEKYFQDLYLQSDGHPYVAKILMGERLKNRSTGNIKIVFAGKDDILTALFERTYNYLSPLAKRIFLTLSNWRSAIPEIALEAVLLRSYNEPLDIEDAIQELIKSSLIEAVNSDTDNSYFVTTPLSAALFAKKKLSVDPLKPAIEVDTKMLHLFGAVSNEDVKLGLKPRVEKLFTEIAQQISQSKSSLENYIPILEFICSKYHDAWILLAELYEEENQLTKAIRCVQKFLETPSSDVASKNGWQRLTRLYSLESNWQGEVHALVESCLVNGVTLSELSNCANAISRIFNEHKGFVDTQEKKISIEKVARVFERKILNVPEASGDDYSRLAWLFLSLNDENKAKQIAYSGLERNPDNIYCQRILDKLQ